MEYVIEHYTLIVSRMSNHWTGFCKELGTATFADTLAECAAELGELVELHIQVKGEVCGGDVGISEVSSKT